MNVKAIIHKLLAGCFKPGEALKQPFAVFRKRCRPAVCSALIAADNPRAYAVADLSKSFPALAVGQLEAGAGGFH